MPFALHPLESLAGELCHSAASKVFIDFFQYRARTIPLLQLVIAIREFKARIPNFSGIRINRPDFLKLSHRLFKLSGTVKRFAQPILGIRGNRTVRIGF